MVAPALTAPAHASKFRGRKKKITILRVLRPQAFSSRLTWLLPGLLLAVPVHPARALPQSSGQATAQFSAAPSLPPPLTAFEFPHAQTLTYEADWRLLPAGTITMHLESAGAQQHVTVTAATLGAISLLYRVNDRFESVFDRTTGCSQSLIKVTEEGRRRVNTDIHFDYVQHRQLLSEKNLVKGNAKQASGPLPNCATDILSAIFYIASQPLNPGETFNFPLADALRVVNVALKSEARETIKVPAGPFNTIRVQPTADAGVTRNRGQIWLWYTDDARHIPVQIKARLFWGTLTFRLTSVENK
jgi:hypothetical protein